MTSIRDHVAALVPAAGLGARLGRGPKVRLSVAGRTLLSWAAETLAPHVREIVVALPTDHMDVDVPAVDRRWTGGREPFVRVIEGGSTRQETVSRLLEATDATYVIVHDAARPLTPSSVVARVLAAAVATGAATAGLQVADTLHDVGTDRPVARDRLVAIQTPQAFDRALLANAHGAAAARGWAGTDDAQLVRAAGSTVTVVPGSAWSHKLTHPGDVAWLEALAATLHLRDSGGPAPEASSITGSA